MASDLSEKIYKFKSSLLSCLTERAVKEDAYFCIVGKLVFGNILILNFGYTIMAT